MQEDLQNQTLTEVTVPLNAGSDCNHAFSEQSADARKSATDFHKGATASTLRLDENVTAHTNEETSIAGLAKKVLARSSKQKYPSGISNLIPSEADITTLETLTYLPAQDSPHNTEPSEPPHTQPEPSASVEVSAVLYKYRCVCGKAFKQQHHLNGHWKESCEKNDEKVAYNCSICFRKFSNQRNLNRHIKQHDNKGPVSVHCTVCGMQLEEGGLKRHMREQHEGQRRKR